MPRGGLVAVVALTLGLAACGSTSSLPKAQFQHAQLGVVTADHPEFAKAEKACGDQVYAEGIEMNGRRITNRAEAGKIWANDMVNLAFPPGAGAVAGMQGALAVSTGNPNAGAGMSAGQSGALPRPPYHQAFTAMEDRVFDCLEAKGFTRMPKAPGQG